ncbi:NucA/NucB deoxyribonuclease domain-containing protein [Actinokineospora globicatena]|uniref:NucA/NucB deoxyribonuclease domain-containing protein n=1 Tax=Actinokineospora globicatena TaxID=103729 RepID=UPI002557BBFA|nr:hypothetical protein [Actinokineospora globicatena]
MTLTTISMRDSTGISGLADTDTIPRSHWGDARSAPTRPRRSAAELAELRKPGTLAPDLRTGVPGVRGATDFKPVRDPVTHAECKNYFLNVPSPAPGYWYKNRFNACHGTTLLSEHFVVRNGRPTKVGAALVDVTFIVSMQENARTAAVSVNLTNWRFIETYPTTNAWTFGANCWDIDASGPSCDPSTVSRSDTPGAWQADGDHGATVTIPTTGVVQPESHGDEQRQHYDFNVYFYLPSSPGANTFYDGPNAIGRCDQARTAVSPNYARASDCVFHQQAGIFTLDASDGAVRESALLIRDAQNNVAATKPGTPGTWIPGKLGTPYPLHRLYYDTVGRDNNRSAAIAKCVEHFGPNYTQRNDPNEPTATNDCDEYPFSATYQGVQMTINAGGNRSYAVRPVHSAQNQNAGNQLGQYLADDHILEEDAYYVNVIN